MVKLSKHTADEMAGRGIFFSYIEATLTAPDRVMRDMTDPALSRSYKIIPEFGIACFAWFTVPLTMILSW